MAGDEYSIFTDRLLGVTLEAVTLVVANWLMVDGEALRAPLGTGVKVKVEVGSGLGMSVGV